MARKLAVPTMVLVVNKTPAVFDEDEVRERVEKAYECRVATVVPHSDELMALSSAGLFAVGFPRPSRDRPVPGTGRRLMS